MRVAVTGAAGDLGTAVLRAICDRGDTSFDEVVAIDVEPPRVTDSGITPIEADVRDPDLERHFDGCDAVIHLAFILIPTSDRARDRSINIDGTANVLAAAEAAAVARLVVASSLSAHGGPGAGTEGVPLSEEQLPTEPVGRFYFDHKAAQEQLLSDWEREHPDSAPTLTRLRPGFIWGPDITNPAAKLMGGPLVALPNDGGRTQLVHQDDVAVAFLEVAATDHPGAFLLVTDDWVSHEDLAEVTGGRVVRLPVRLVEVGLDLAAKLRLSPVDSEWAVSGDHPGNPSKARAELGWEASMSSAESARAMMLQRGRTVDWGATDPRPEVAERALGVTTRLLLEAAAPTEDGGTANPGMRGVNLEGALAGATHEWIRYRDRRVHLEVHEGGGEGASTVLIHHGLGDHVRRFTPLAGLLAADGYNVVATDRPGHGPSEGRRGHCPLEWALELVDESIAFARDRFGSGPVLGLGDSLGGITLWYALTREVALDAVLCHCIGHPDVHHDPSMRWLGPLMGGIGRLAPMAPVPVRQIADYAEVALDPGTQRAFDDEVDRIFNFTVSAASAASYVGFEPRRPWAEVETPATVWIGGSDAMVTPEFTRRSFDREHPPGAELVELEDMGHQIFLDHLADAYPRLRDWVERQSS